MTVHFFKDKIWIFFTTHPPKHTALYTVGPPNFYGMNEKAECSSPSCGIKIRNEQGKTDVFFQPDWIYPTSLIGQKVYNTRLLLGFSR